MPNRVSQYIYPPVAVLCDMHTICQEFYKCVHERSGTVPELIDYCKRLQKYAVRLGLDLHSIDIRVDTEDKDDVISRMLIFLGKVCFMLESNPICKDLLKNKEVLLKEQPEESLSLELALLELKRMGDELLIPYTSRELA